MIYYLMAKETIERNLCAEAGCPAACCRDMYIDVPKDEVKKYFEGATYVEDGHLPERPRAPEGVLFTDHHRIPGFALVRINGKCPNLTEDAECRIYKGRPNACGNFEIGKRGCDEARQSQYIPLERVTLIR